MRLLKNYIALAAMLLGMYAYDEDRSLMGKRVAEAVQALKRQGMSASI